MTPIRHALRTAARIEARGFEYVTTIDATKLSPSDFCKHFNACTQGSEFATKYDTMADVWESCEKPHWLLWILAKLQITPERELRLFACWCATETPGMIKPTAPRSLAAIAAAIRLANGLADEAEISAAMSAMSAERSAAMSAMSSARSSARAAAWAARSSAWAAESAAESAARSAARSAQCAHFRTLIKNPFI